MSEEKDDLKSIKVYKFNNTKENWHEFALKFRVIADTRGYFGVIDGTMVPTDEQEKVAVTTEDKGNVLKEKKDKLVENSSSRFFQISCSQGIHNSSRLSCYLLLRLLVYMYLSQLMRTFTNYLKCIVFSF